MGYTTKFSGCVALSRPLTMAEAKTLLNFNEEPDEIPQPNPGGYMQWVPSKSLDAIGWDGQEKFYDYVPWMEWVCAWLKERGIVANGELHWSGEDATDNGRIVVIENTVTSISGSNPTKKFKPLTLRELADMALEAATAT